MALSFETTHEYYIKDAHIFWCESHNMLRVTDSDYEDSVMLSGVSEDTLKEFINGLFKNYPELAKEFRQTPKAKPKTTSVKAS